ncbi:MAG: hypothetical protein EA404_11840 [Spirochaetaceae bacterium]|nr:MAG: hypothetical protein EA404_11840 [Spirochaetaceae bacterium]
MENTLNILSRKAGFNTALRHFKTVNAFVESLDEGYNFADVINAALTDGSLQRYQVRSIINALLVEKFAYAYKSHNLTQTIETSEKIVGQLDGWGNIQLVLAFHHPQAGLLVINPKDPAQWEEALPLARDELVVVYAGSVDGKLSYKVLKGAVEDFLKILYGRTVKEKKEYAGSGRKRALPRYSEAAAAASAAAAAAEPASSTASAGKAPVAAPKAEPVPTGTRRITPRYSVLVTNELFHNGNVEAWKRIIQSYRSKYEGLDVLIWYENERINDINALFKWGKVKHGTPIMFSVAGDNIKDVSKLQRYLFEGASPRFEAFLHGAVDRVLDLF